MPYVIVLYKQEVNDTRICVSSMTTTNTSKEFLAFSDFMFPEESPNYMRNWYDALLT